MPIPPLENEFMSRHIHLEHMDLEDIQRLVLFKREDQFLSHERKLLVYSTVRTAIQNEIERVCWFLQIKVPDAGDDTIDSWSSLRAEKKAHDSDEFRL